MRSIAGRRNYSERNNVLEVFFVEGRAMLARLRRVAAENNSEYPDHAQFGQGRFFRSVFMGKRSPGHSVGLVLICRCMRTPVAPTRVRCIK